MWCIGSYGGGGGIVPHGSESNHCISKNVLHEFLRKIGAVNVYYNN